MKRTATLALALTAGLVGTAHAQDMGREFDQVRSQHAEQGNAVSFRFNLPFGNTEAPDNLTPRFSLSLTPDLGSGQRGAVDVLSFSFAGPSPRVESPLVLRADGDGNWFLRPRNLLLLGAGVAVAWVIYDHNQDDDSPPPPT